MTTKDFHPPARMTFIKDPLCALIANGLQIRMMKLYVIPLRCGQSVTNWRVRIARVDHANVAWRAPNNPVARSRVPSGTVPWGIWAADPSM